MVFEDYSWSFLRLPLGFVVSSSLCFQYASLQSLQSCLVLQYPRLAAVTGLPFLTAVGSDIAPEFLLCWVALSVWYLYILTLFKMIVVILGYAEH